MTNNNFTLQNDGGNETGLLETIMRFEEDKFKPSQKLQNLINSPFTVALYVRVSTPGQAEPDKVSPEEQRKALLKLASDNGWKVSGIYEEPGISGKFMNNREVFNQMLGDVFEKKIDIIASWANDRVARNVTEMTALRARLWEHKVQITSVIEPVTIKPKKELYGKQDVMEKLVSYVMDWKSEQDNAVRVERFEMGKRGKANKGLIPNKAPYGYNMYFEYLPGGKLNRVQHVEINAEQSAVIREIFTLYDKKLFGVRKIAETLNFRGVPSPKKHIWGASTVKYILNNPTYTGCVRYGWRLSKSARSLDRLAAGHKGIIVQGVHPVIINPAQFKRVNERLKRRGQLGGKAVHSKGLLSGLLKCPRCGGNAYLSSFHNGHTYQKIPERDRHKYKKAEVYLCSKYAQYGKSGCQKRYIVSRKKIETKVIRLITKMASDADVKDRYIKEMRKSNKQELLDKTNVLEKERNTIPAIRSKLFVLLQHGRIGDQEFDSERIRLEKEEKELNNQIELVKQKVAGSEKIEAQTENAILALGDFKAAWALSGHDGRKELITSIIGGVKLRDEEVFVEFRSGL